MCLLHARGVDVPGCSTSLCVFSVAIVAFSRCRQTITLLVMRVPYCTGERLRCVDACSGRVVSDQPPKLGFARFTFSFLVFPVRSFVLVEVLVVDVLFNTGTIVAGFFVRFFLPSESQ